jgi:UDP-N-acetylmuramoyl-tripeptide--D-alanyl-D-alanine ligase
VLGEMTELGEVADDEHAAIGRLVAGLGVDELIVVGAGARHIHTAATLSNGWNGESHFVATAELAHELLREDLQAGDLVLVKSSKSAGLRFLGDRLAGVVES